MPAARKLENPVSVAFARLLKVDEEKRLVYCRAVQEVPDRAGEEFDYAGSKPYFQDWSKTQLEASLGKSAGNIREMHGKNAAGVILPEGGLIFNDDECAIDTVTHVVDDAVWKKIIAGVYTGQSIGGEYISKSQPDTARNGLVRYIAKPSEISFVDRPAVPTATIFEIQKKDGSIVKQAFVAPVELALMRRDGKDLALKITASDLPAVGEEFDLNGQRYALIKSEDGKAIVDEIYELLGTPEELNDLSKAAVELGLSIADLTKLARTHAPGVLKMASTTDIEAKARALCKAEGTDPDKQIGLSKGGGKRLAWAEYIDAANQELAKAAVANVKTLEDPTPEAVKAKAIEISGLDLAKFDALPEAERNGHTEKAKAELLKVAPRSDANPAEGKAKYGSVTFADATNKKYPIDTEAHIKAAWSYINMPRNAKKYSADDLKTIKGKIKAAAKAKGIEISEKLDGGADHEAAVAKLAKSLALEAFEPTEADLKAKVDEIAKRDKVSITKADGTADAPVLEKVSNQAVEELLPADAATKFVPAAERAILLKGLYTCGQLAFVLDSLCNIAESCELETMREGDESGVCEELYTHIAGLGECLREMIAEEISEEVNGGEASVGGGYMAAADGLVARVDSIRKATHVAVPAKRVQKMHDNLVSMGAKCDKGASVLGDPAVRQKFTPKSTKAAMDELEASKDVSVTAKEVLKGCMEGEPLAKLEGALTAPSAEQIEKAVTAAVAPVKALLDQATAKITKLEAQPAPATVRVRAVAKEDDGGGEGMRAAASLAANVAPVLKTDGTVDDVATAMKMVRAKGGTPVMQKPA